jgi:hypothetical protein
MRKKQHKNTVRRAMLTTVLLPQAVSIAPVAESKMQKNILNSKYFELHIFLLIQGQNTIFMAAIIYC